MIALQKHDIDSLLRMRDEVSTCFSIVHTLICQACKLRFSFIAPLFSHGVLIKVVLPFRIEQKKVVVVEELLRTI